MKEVKELDVCKERFPALVFKPWCGGLIWRGKASKPACASLSLVSLHVPVWIGWPLLSVIRVRIRAECGYCLRQSCDAKTGYMCSESLVCGQNGRVMHSWFAVRLHQSQNTKLRSYYGASWGGASL